MLAIYVTLSLIQFSLLLFQLDLTKLPTIGGMGCGGGREEKCPEYPGKEKGERTGEVGSV